MATKNYLSANNSKLKRAGIYAWGIPAYQASNGFRTCPGASACIAGCYAKQGFFVMPVVRQAQEDRLALSKKGWTFIDTIDDEIKRRKVSKLRVHDSGDFYSQRYLDAWLEIMRRNPRTKFYAYTKMIPLFDLLKFKGRMPDNFKVIYSFGGKFDSYIDKAKHAHAEVFDSALALKRARYSDASHDDTVAMRARKVGLIYHGANSRRWVTA